jgi:hypothetical protein
MYSPEPWYEYYCNGNSKWEPDSRIDRVSPDNMLQYITGSVNPADSSYGRYRIIHISMAEFT